MFYLFSVEGFCFFLMHGIKVPLPFFLFLPDRSCLFPLAVSPHREESFSFSSRKRMKISFPLLNGVFKTRLVTVFFSPPPQEGGETFTFCFFRFL